MCGKNELERGAVGTGHWRQVVHASFFYQIHAELSAFLRDENYLYLPTYTQQRNLTCIGMKRAVNYLKVKDKN